MPRKKKHFQNKNIEYYGQHELKYLQDNFIAQYDYNFWMHKAHILTHSSTNPERTAMLKPKDYIAAVEVIVQSLKIELHMTSLHCTESFFRVFDAMLYSPFNP